jgi:hypothetical protein
VEPYNLQGVTQSGWNYGILWLKSKSAVTPVRNSHTTGLSWAAWYAGAGVIKDLRISNRFWGSVHVVRSTSNIRVPTGGMIDHEICIDSSNPELSWRNQCYSARIACTEGEGLRIRLGVSAMTKL